jgi:hypothetical protein
MVGVTGLFEGRKDQNNLLEKQRDGKIKTEKQ